MLSPDHPVVSRYLAAIEWNLMVPHNVLNLLSCISYDILPSNLPNECFVETIDLILPLMTETYCERKQKLLSTLSKMELSEIRAYARPPLAVEIGMRAFVLLDQIFDGHGRPRKIHDLMPITYVDVKRALSKAATLKYYSNFNEFDGEMKQHEFEVFYRMTKPHSVWLTNYARNVSRLLDVFYKCFTLLNTYIEVLYPHVRYQSPLKSLSDVPTASPLAIAKHTRLNPFMKCIETSVIFSAHGPIQYPILLTATAPEQPRIRTMFERFMPKRGDEEGKYDNYHHLCVYMANECVYHRDELKSMTWDMFYDFVHELDALHCPVVLQEDDPGYMPSLLMRIQYEYLMAIKTVGLTTFDMTPGSSRVMFAHCVRNCLTSAAKPAELQASAKANKTTARSRSQESGRLTMLLRLLHMLIHNPPTFKFVMDVVPRVESLRDYDSIMKVRRADVEDRIENLVNTLAVTTTTTPAASSSSSSSFTLLRSYVIGVQETRRQYRKENM